MDINLYSDGAARGNPNGPGGYGTILQYIDANGQLYEKEFSKGYEETTNNRMELMGVIVGLEALKKPCVVNVYSDSKYVIDAFNKDWISNWQKTDFRRGKSNEVKNIDLWERLLLATKNHRIVWNWVKGHAGHPMNERCDKLATMAADKLK